MQQKRLLVTPIALFLSLLTYLSFTLVTPSPAVQAHGISIAHTLNAYVIGSDPVDSSTIGRIPNEVRIFFNAPISTMSVAHVYAIQNGNLVDVTKSASRVSAANSQELDAAIKAPDTQPEGSYEVIWTAVARSDGNTTYGIIGFDVGFSGTGTSGTAVLGPSSSNNLEGIHKLDTTAVLSIAWEWLVIAALTFWIGLLVIEQLVLTAGRGSGLFPRARKHTYALEWLCLFVLLCGEIISVILRMVRLAQASQSFSGGKLLSIIPDTTYGIVWTMRLLLIITAMLFLYFTQRKKIIVPEPEQEPLTNFERLSTQELKASGPRKTRQLLETPLPQAATPDRPTIFWLTLAGLITLTYVFTNSVVPVLSPYISATVFYWLHLVAQGIWLGGFTYLAYVLLPLLIGAEIEYNTETLTFLLRRLTPLLITGMAIQVISGLFLGEASIDNIHQLTTDPFGRTLLVQIIVTILTVCLSMYALCIIRPKLTHQANLLPVVKADLPARRTRQSELSNTGKRLKLIAKSIAFCGATILLCSALQSFFAPPIDFPDVTYAKQPLTEANQVINTQTRQMGNLSVTLQVSPGRVNYDHAIIIGITDNQGKPVTDAEVKLTTDMQLMDMGKTEVTVQGGNPVYVANFDKRAAFSMAGLWEIKVEIQQPKQKVKTDTFKIVLTA